jgi:SAM-dependent methyltransferase
MWLTQQGFDSTGVDVSGKAIEMAQEKAVKNGIGTAFFKVDFLKEDVRGAPYKFIFDRGCFHSFDKKKEKQLYAKNVHTILENEGLWLTLTGNYDDGRLDVGPPKLKALDITNAVETYFEIISLTQGRFDSNDKVPSKI